MLRAEDILGGPTPTGLKVGIGAGTDDASVTASVADFGDSALVFRDPVEMADALWEGRIQGAVRGNLPASETLSALKARFGLSSLQRMVIMESREGKVFFLASVGIDEGWTVEEKAELVRGGSVLMRRLGLEPRVAVMSGGREGDRGRNPAVDRSIDDALELVSLLRGEGYDAYHAEILLESAVADANMVIAPDGMSGNIIFRALHFLGGCRALGAPVLNLGKVFVDTSRVKSDFRDSISLALRLAEEV